MLLDACSLLPQTGDGPINSVHDDLVIYGNILLDSKFKMELFCFTLPLWLDYWKRPAVIRIRGGLSGQAKEFCEQFDDVDCRVGTAFSTWKAQARADMIGIDSRFFFQYLEDHMPSPTAPPSQILLDQMVTERVDILQYSWFQSYSPVRSELGHGQLRDETTLIAVALGRDDLLSLGEKTGLMTVSLSSVFRKDFYMTLLESHRPMIRRFDPSGPFAVEQRTRASWFAPLTAAFPSQEIGICVDDDHLVSGSSAMARGLYAGDRAFREWNHHRPTSLRSLLGRFLPVRLGPIRKILSKVLTLGDIIWYSAQSPILTLLDKIKANR